MDRRDFLKNTAKITTGAALLAALPPEAAALISDIKEATITSKTVLFVQAEDLSEQGVLDLSDQLDALLDCEFFVSNFEIEDVRTLEAEAAVDRERRLMETAEAYSKIWAQADATRTELELAFAKADQIRMEFKSGDQTKVITMDADGISVSTADSNGTGHGWTKPWEGQDLPRQQAGRCACGKTHEEHS